MGATFRILQMLLSTAPFPTPRASASLRSLARRSLPTLPAFRFLHRTPRRNLPLPPLRAADHGVRALSGAPELHADLGERRAWPEWSAFVDHVMAAGYGDRGAGSVDDLLEDSIEVPEGFSRCARACLSFAYDRPMLLQLLPKEDIRVVVHNVSPSLFKNCSDLVRRMDVFLNAQGSTMLNYENVQTVDLVRYLLGYAHNYMFRSQQDDVNNTEFVDVSVHNLLKEMVNLSGPLEHPYSTDSINGQSPLILEQPSGRSNIQMKRGDWTCPKCNFMNFARNMNCLECREARPKRQLTGGEWECPQCDFFNYGRNMACLRCDCKRPGNSFSHTAAEDTGFGNTRSGAGQVPSRNGSINRSLDRILGKISEIPSPGNSSSHQGAIGRRGGISPQKRELNDVPFVPLSPDMFRTPGGTNTKKPSGSPSLNSRTDHSGVLFSENSKSAGGSPGAHKSSDPCDKTVEFHDAGKFSNPISDGNFPEIMPMRKGENRFVVSKKKDRSLTSPQYKRRLAMEQANGSSFVPFVPFPPGYFARKDNQPEAGSAAPKAELANAEAAFSENTQNVVERSDDSTSAQMSPEKGSNWQGGNIESSRRNLYGYVVDPSCMSGGSTSISYPYDNFQKNEVESWESRSSQGVNSNSVDGSWNSSQPSFETRKKIWSNDGGLSSNGNNQGGNHSRDDVACSDSPNPSSWSNKIDGQNVHPTSGNSTCANNAGRTIPQAEANQGSKKSSSWKSLEGSAVLEPDPSDMSEEAKAQRWFRRVAQITDISELANIPDEDFPQIMPMRKGVNRFVVSKRKTPLERRLTSPQYRRNLPIVRSEPENDSSDQGQV